MSQPGAELAPATARAPRAGGSRSRAWWFVLIGRVVVLAVAATASTFALLGAGREAGDPVRYRCPMHPEAIAAEPAACPICGMALVRDEAHPDAATRPARPLPARTALATRRMLAEQVRVPAWADAGGAVVALLDREDLVGLAPDQPAQFFAATTPAVGADVALIAEPPVGWDRATVRARFRATAALPAAPGSLVIPARPRALVVVPSGAILDAPDGPYVFVVDPASHRDVRRAVAIGREHHGVTTTLSGLAEGDEVVIRDAFFVAAERGLHPAEAP